MSELAITARAKAREKVERLTRTPKGDVDASGWREPLGEQGMAPGLQTGPRPVSRRQFRAGGKVHGGRFEHAGRKPRASGGMTANEYQNRDMKEANESREGPKHLGGMKKGGRAHKATGGNMTAMALPQAFTPVARAAGGRTGKMMGGPMMGRPELQPRMGNGMPAGGVAGGAPMSRPMPGMRPELRGMRKDGGRAEHGESCKCSKCSGGAVGKAAGGGVSYGGSRPEGGRIARAGGGRTKKGTTVNIIIAPSGGGAAARPPMPMPPPGAPPGGPLGLHQGTPPTPPAMPPGGAPPPMGPPMMRAHGGRAYPTKTGGAGGLARLAKKNAYGGPPIHGAAAKPPMSQAAKPRKHGGRTNYPIDAGGGGGQGRLEKLRAYGP